MALADNESPPPLTRRVPGASRGGPSRSSRPALTDAVLEHMQAAVDAERARSREPGTDRAETGTAVADGAGQPPAQDPGPDRSPPSDGGPAPLLFRILFVAPSPLGVFAGG